MNDNELYHALKRIENEKRRRRNLVNFFGCLALLAIPFFLAGGLALLMVLASL